MLESKIKEMDSYLEEKNEQVTLLSYATVLSWFNHETDALLRRWLMIIKVGSNVIDSIPSFLQVNDAEKLLEAREKELEEVAALLHRTKEAQTEQSIKVCDLGSSLVCNNPL